MEKKVRVRYAPSPTGPQHIGGIRTALYNYLFAKKHGGECILRIEDTDEKRFVPGAVDYLLDSVKWCGFEFDEGVHVGGDYGPYQQSQRKDIYQKYAQQLLDSGHAYYAFDTSEELDEMRERLKAMKVAAPQYNGTTRTSMKNSLTLSEDEVKRKLEAGDPYVLRLKVPRNQEIRIKDEVRGWVVVSSNQIDDKVLMKETGTPTYHLANVVDDHLMEITHVIRGEEWLPSAPLHSLLYEFLGWKDEMPKFAHLPLLLKPNGNGKLSKRDGDKLGFPVFPLNWNDPVTDELSSGYKEGGYFPGAFLNMLAFLGWNPGTEQELFSMEELIEAFSIERVGKSGAKFDFDKVKWYNQQYLRMLSGEELAKLAGPIAEEKGYDLSNVDLAGICEMMKERATFTKDLIEEGSYFFERPAVYDEKTVKKKWKEQTPAIIEEFLTQLEGIAAFKADNIESVFKGFLEAKELGMGAVLPNFRVLVTGKGMGPSMFTICELLGKEETIERIKVGKAAITELKAV